jgi:hypothetical protein
MIDLQSRDGSPIRLFVALVFLAGAIVGLRWGSLPGTDPDLVRTTALVVIAVVAATEAIINIVAMRGPEDQTASPSEEPDDDGDDPDTSGQETIPEKEYLSPSTGGGVNENQTDDSDAGNMAIASSQDSPSEYQSDTSDEVEVQTAEKQAGEDQTVEIQSTDDELSGTVGSTDDTSTPLDPDNTQQPDDSERVTDPVPEESSVIENDDVDSVQQSPTDHERADVTESQSPEPATQDRSSGETVQEDSDDGPTEDDDGLTEEEEESQSTVRQTVVADTDEGDGEIDPAPRGHEPDWR